MSCSANSLLTKNLGAPFARWYDHVYGDQSAHVHAADMVHFLEIDHEATTTPRWQSETESVRAALQTGISLFHMVMGMLHQQIGFGSDFSKTITAACQEYKGIIAEE